jgi:hypothetical protein
MNEHLSSQQLSDLAEGLLPPDHVRAVQAHLAACAHCRQALAQRRALVERLQREVPACLARVTPPPTLRWEHARHRVPRKQRSLAMLRYVRAATASVAVLTLFFGLVLGLNVLFQQVASPTLPDGEFPVIELGPLVEMAGNLPLGENPSGFQPLTLTIKAALPQSPDSVPLHRVEPALQEVSPQEVRQWAERLGMGPVRVYQHDGLMNLGEMGSGYAGLNADGQFLSLSSGTLQFIGGEVAWGLPVGNDLSETTADEAVAQAEAQAFLNRLAPYLVVVEGATERFQITFSLTDSFCPTPLRCYQAWPVLNGLPIVVNVRDAGIGTLIVGPQGQVNGAILNPIRLAPTGERVSPRPPETVLRAFVGGEARLLSGSNWESRQGESPGFFRRSQPHEEARSVTLVGWISSLRGVEGETDILLLGLFASANSFILEGVDTAERPDPSQLVQVWGTLRDAAAPTRRLQVERWETVDLNSSSDFPVWNGETQRRDADLWLRTAEGQEFLLPEPPEELLDGVRVGVVGTPASDAPQRMDWVVIFVEPEVEESGPKATPRRLYELPPLARPLDAEFYAAPTIGSPDSAGIQLAGYELAAEEASLSLSLWWAAQGQVHADYVVFAHLFDPQSGALVSTHDAVPRQGWPVGEVFSDTIQLALSGVPSGDYQLAIGLYDAATGERLLASVLDDGRQRGDQQLVLPDVVEVREGAGHVEPLEETYPDEFGLSGVVIEEVRLAYVVVESLPTKLSADMNVTTELCYLLSGYSSDGQYRVTFHVRAVEPSK